MRKLLVGGAVAGTLASLFLPAGAATAATTPTTLTITIAAGALNISAPASSTLDNSVLATTFATPVATPIGVQIVDDRGGLLQNFVLSVNMTNFTNSGESVAASNTAYTSLLGVLAPSPYDLAHGYLLAVVPPKLNMALSNSNQTVATSTSLTGKTAAVVNVSLSTPASNYVVAGSYTATLTHTVV